MEPTATQQTARKASAEVTNKSLWSIGDKMRYALKIYQATDPEAGHLNYLADYLEMDLKEKFAQMWLNFCQLTQYALDINLQLIQIDATKGLRALLGRDDVHGELASGSSEIVYVSKCVAINITHVYVDHRIPGHEGCFKFAPATDAAGKMWFLSPGSRDLVPTSPSVPCSRITPALLQAESQWKEGLRNWETAVGDCRFTLSPHSRTQTAHTISGGVEEIAGSPSLLTLAPRQPTPSRAVLRRSKPLDEQRRIWVCSTSACAAGIPLAGRVISPSQSIITVPPASSPRRYTTPSLHSRMGTGPVFLAAPR